MGDRGPADYDDDDSDWRRELLRRDNIIYVRDRGNSSDLPNKALAWIAGIGAMVVTAAILFVSSLVLQVTDRLARVETTVQVVVQQLSRRNP